MKKFPKYIKTSDGYIGAFSHIEYNRFPVYRFEGGQRVADNSEIEGGADNIDDLKPYGGIKK